MTIEKSPLPQWLLERHALKEVPPHARSGTASASEDRLAEIEEANAEFFRKYPAEQVVPQIAARAVESASNHKSPHKTVWIAAFAAASLALAVVVAEKFPSGNSPQVVANEDLRLKGGRPALSVFRKHDGNIERLSDGERVKRGDVLQLSYTSFGARYGVIVSIDGANQVTLHHPRSAADDGELADSGAAILPQGYQLDDAPQFERFFFVTSTRPFSVESILNAVRNSVRNQPLALPEGIDQTSITLVKELP